MSELTQYTIEQVTEHNTRQSPWLIIHDKVYDVQKFLEEVSFLLFEFKMINFCCLLTN